MYVLLTATIVAGLSTTVLGNLLGHPYDYRPTIAPYFRSIFYFYAHPDVSLINAAPTGFHIHVMLAWVLSPRGRSPAWYTSSAHRPDISPAPTSSTGPAAAGGELPDAAGSRPGAGAGNRRPCTAGRCDGPLIMILGRMTMGTGTGAAGGQARSMGFMARAVRDLHPGYFAFVMATGIISTGTFLLGPSWLSRALLIAASAGLVVLSAALAIRLAVFRSSVIADIQAPERVFGFFTITAGLDVLGVRLGAAGHPLATATMLVLIDRGFDGGEFLHRGCPGCRPPPDAGGTAGLAGRGGPGSRCPRSPARRLSAPPDAGVPHSG